MVEGGQVVSRQWDGLCCGGDSSDGGGSYGDNTIGGVGLAREEDISLRLVGLGREWVCSVVVVVAVLWCSEPGCICCYVGFGFGSNTYWARAGDETGQ
jgi:hypothetical protein